MICILERERIVRGEREGGRAGRDTLSSDPFSRR